MISGRCVFYAIPDDTIKQDAIRHGKYIGNNAFFSVSAPYIQLYRAKFDRAPLKEVNRILDTISFILTGNVLTMEKLVTIASGGMQALRWMCTYNVHQYMHEPLYKAHIACLDLARYQDRQWQKDILDEAINRNPKPPRDHIANIIDFGQEDAKHVFRPNILLALARPTHTYNTPRHPISHTGKIVGVGFAHFIHDFKLSTVLATRP